MNGIKLILLNDVTSKIMINDRVANSNGCAGRLASACHKSVNLPVADVWLILAITKFYCRQHLFCEQNITFLLVFVSAHISRTTAYVPM